MAFSDNFIFGTATAAYQIEGGAAEGGRTDSVWDTSCRLEGKIKRGQDGVFACDHYHRLEEDVALLRELGVQAYRFSVSWSRVLPEGTGKPNEEGLAFYDRLIDLLLENGIEPWMTMFHWDYPQVLEDKGGWLSEESPEWFAEYAGLLVDRYSDRVTHFLTFNEPQCFIGGGYAYGFMAPFKQLPTKDALQMAHNVLKAHGMAVRIIREQAKHKCLVGFAPTQWTTCPSAPEDPVCMEHARRLTFDFRGQTLTSTAWWSDPIFLGHYPDGAEEYFGSDMPEIKDGDMELISQPLDFYACNVYSASICDRDGNDLTPALKPGFPITQMDWNILPQGLYYGAKFLYERYGKPIAITENGMANADLLFLDGHVHDPARIDFVVRYLSALEQAEHDGCELLGYFYWSLLDNFEWCQGYERRFGLVYVDYETFERTKKDSFYFFREVIRTRGESLKSPCYTVEKY